MGRKTIKMLAVALVAAFALSSMAEAAPRKTRHRAKHSSRVASGGAPATVKKPAGKKKVTAARSRSGARGAGFAQTPSVKKAPVTRRPTTKPR